jgi:hypothetical protein
VTAFDYIAILFDDLGFTGRQRKDFIWLRYRKEYADELVGRQKSAIIDELKEMKENKKKC